MGCDSSKEVQVVPNHTDNNEHAKSNGSDTVDPFEGRLSRQINTLYWFNSVLFFLNKLFDFHAIGFYLFIVTVIVATMGMSLCHIIES